MRSWSRAVVGGSRPSLSAPRLSLSLAPALTNRSHRWYPRRQAGRQTLYVHGGLSDLLVSREAILQGRCRHSGRYKRSGLWRCFSCGWKNLSCFSSGFLLLVMLSLMLAIKSIFVIWNKCRPISPLSWLIQQLHAAYIDITLGSDAKWMSGFHCICLHTIISSNQNLFLVTRLYICQGNPNSLLLTTM